MHPRASLTFAIGAVTLAPSTEAGRSSGLTFHYPPYAVGPYAEGEYVVGGAETLSDAGRSKNLRRRAAKGDDNGTR